MITQQRPYSMINNELLIELSDLDLTAFQFRLLLKMLGLSDKDGIVKHHQKTLAEEMKVTKQYMSLSIIRLSELGYIERVKNGVYRISENLLFRKVPDDVTYRNKPRYKVVMASKA